MNFSKKFNNILKRKAYSTQYSVLGIYKVLLLLNSDKFVANRQLFSTCLDSSLLCIRDDHIDEM